MINAIIESKGNTLVTELPIGIYTLYERLLSVGISANPKTIRLTDNEEDDIRVKLYSESDFENHLLRVLDEENTLADANLLTAVVQNAHEELRNDIEQNILYDQYTSMNEVIDDIRTMTANTGPVKITFYCPLVGTIEDDEGLSSSVGGRFLHSYQWAIEEAIDILLYDMVGTVTAEKRKGYLLAACRACRAAGTTDGTRNSRHRSCGRNDTACRA